MIATAARPRPETSPTTNVSRPVPLASTVQSPPISSGRTPGKYFAATSKSSPRCSAKSGKSASSRACCRVSSDRQLLVEELSVGLGELFGGAPRRTRISVTKAAATAKAEPATATIQGRR